ncbi:archease [Candidatus Woesearchaeota archaeon CG_4_10_14_0_2_um_filter_33_10]|nr:MAG: archease [Candidatus Woesearchaeota archaeon CG_4_10_14_0_2_um_filter_33_10]
MEKYKFIDDLTSDVMFEAYGKNLKELFKNSALALFSVICDIKKVGEEKTVDIEVNGDSLEELMVNWLQDLIALVDTDELFFSMFEIVEINENNLKAKAYGEPISPKKAGVVVKGVTYYKLKLEKIKDKFKATISLDI